MSIEAMKQALEALECLFGIPERFTGKGGGDVAVWTLGGSYRAQQAIPVLRQAIEQAERQKSKPVCWDGEEKCPNRQACCDAEECLYTTPQPQREWVGLTQEDIDIAFDDTQEGGGFNEFAKAIEQILRRKNT